MFITDVLVKFPAPGTITWARVPSLSLQLGLDRCSMTMVDPPRGTMTESEMRQQISLAYIHAVVTSAGLVIGRWDTDYDGIDLTIRTRAKYPALNCVGSSLDVQLKCTSQESKQHKASVSWPLKRDTIIKLREDPLSLAILAVLVVPPDYVDWLDQDHSRMLSRGAMYFSVASDWDEIADGNDSMSIHCSRENLLTPEKLLQLMHRAAEVKVQLF